MIKRLFASLLLLLLIYLAYHFKSLSYGLKQAKGQAEVLWNAVPVQELMEKSSIADSVKEKFRFISSVREYAQTTLGLSESKNYTTYYDQKGEPILWVVTASPEFKIKAYQWSFPLAGNFAYKGFFNYDLAKEEAEKLKQQGFDTEIDEVSAWSTLGWFKDPILSSMLNKSEGRLSELIIHELTHATIFLKNENKLNENLATFIGREGAKRFLKDRFGKDSKVLASYLASLDRKKWFKSLSSQAKNSLDSLYSSFPENATLEEKRHLKYMLLEEYKQNLLRSKYYSQKAGQESKLQGFNPNNAFFSGISTYHESQDSLSSVLESNYNGNLKAFIESLKQL